MSSALALSQDADGYLWIGTTSGLVRFDGSEFGTWATLSEHPLPADAISVVLAARDGSIWIGFMDVGGTSRIVNGEVRNFGRDDGLQSGSIEALIEDRLGTVWAGGREGLARFRGDRWEYVAPGLGLPKASVHSLHEDRQGMLWVGTSAGVFRRTTSTNPFEMVAPHVVRSFSEDRAGNIWAITRSGALISFSPGAVRQHSVCAANARTLLHDREGNLWIGTVGSGVLRIGNDEPTAKTRCTSVGTQYDPAGTMVFSLIEDREHNLWAGTNRGVLRLYRPDLTTITTLQDRVGTRSRPIGGGNWPRAVAVTADGSVWIGTPAGLGRIVTHEAGHFAVRLELPGLEVRALHASATGMLWFATPQRVGVLSEGRPVFVAEMSSREASFLALTSDARGIPWLCHTAPPGVFYLRQDELTPFTAYSTTRAASCTTVYGDTRGRVWIGFEDGSVGLQDGERFELFPRAVHGRVGAFYEDARGVVWIATTAGLGRFLDGRFSMLTSRNGLPDGSVSAVLEDRRGSLWVVFRTGIIRLSPQEFDRGIADAAYQVQYAIYNASDGLVQPTTVIAAPNAWRGPDGRLWFVTSRGVVLINPDRLQPSPRSAVTRIERIVADGQVFRDARQRVRLPPGTANVEINYAFVSLSAASKARFQYMLKGFERHWVEAGTRRQAFYTRLPPGDYQFVVRATANGSQSDAEWAFSIQPTFYQTGWFYLACTGGVGFAIWGAWQLRLRTLRRHFEAVLGERARIARELHDTVLQSMAGVALDLEAIARKADGSRAANEELRRVRRELEGHIAEARQSIYDLRSATSEPLMLPEALQASAEQVVQNEDVRFELAVTGEPRPCSREVEDQLVRIAQEALRNAVRHGKPNAIQVQLAYEPDALRLRVSDDGRGFDPDVPTNGPRWGLMGMQERAKRIGGSLIIQSRPGAGTAVETRVTGVSSMRRSM
jgi:signal transduction histidine kinase